MIIDVPFDKDAKEIYHVFARTGKFAGKFYIKRRVSFTSMALFIITNGNDGMFFDDRKKADDKVKELNQALQLRQTTLFDGEVPQ